MYYVILFRMMEVQGDILWDIQSIQEHDTCGWNPKIVRRLTIPSGTIMVGKAGDAMMEMMEIDGSVGKWDMGLLYPEIWLFW